MADSPDTSGKPFTTPEGVVDPPVDELTAHKRVMGSILESPNEKSVVVPGRE